MTKSLSGILALVLISSAIIGPIEVALAPASHPNSSESWLMFRHDPRHTGASTSKAPDDNKTTGGLLWTKQTGGAVESSPAVANGRVFIGSNDGYVYAFNETTGVELWKTKVGNLVSSSPAVADGKVFAGAMNGTVCALDETNGNVIWSNATLGGVAEGVYSSPTVVENKVFVGSMNRTVYVFNGTTGHRLWIQTIEDNQGNIKSSPAVAYGKVFVGCLDLRVYALGEITGEHIWNFTTGGMIVSSPAVANETVLIGSSNGWIYSLNASSGAHIWNYTTGGAVRSSPAVADGKIFVGSDDGNVYALDQYTGTHIWNYTTGGAVRSSPAVADGKIFVGSDDWRLYALNKTTGSLMWSYRTNGRIRSSPAVADGIVFVGSYDKNVYAFGPNTAPINCFDYYPEEPIENQDVTFDASCTYDQEIDSISYVWNFGDGTNDTGVIVVHAYGTAGTYNVTLTATDEHGAENTTRQPVTVWKHDVAVVDVSPSKLGVVEGETLNVSVTVENQGDFDEFNVTVAAYAGEIEIGNKTIQFLVKGTNETVTISWDTTGFSKGDYAICAEANIVPDETDTADNRLCDGSVGVAVHDVAIISVIASKNVAYQGEIVDINVTVENQGSYPETFNVTTCYDGSLINSTKNVSFNVGALETLTFQWNTSTVPLGNHTISSNASVVENETDIADNFNCTTVEIISLIHDVAIVNVTASSQEVFIPDPVNVAVTVENQGNFTENVNITTCADTNMVGSQNVTLEPGENAIVVIAWNTTNFSPREYLISANATIPIDDDPSDNHRPDDTVTLRPREHDVAVTHVDPSCSVVFWPNEVHVEITVVNLGNFTESDLNLIAYADKNVTALGDEITIGSETVTILEPGESQILEFDWDTGSIFFSDLSCTFYVCANVSTVPEESILDNNHFCDGTVIVKAPIVDVAVTKVEPSERNPIQGKIVNIYITVKNEGIDASGINVTTYANNAHNITIGSHIIQFLASLANETVTTPWNTTSVPLGDYTISANATVSGDEKLFNNALTDGNVTITEPRWHDVVVMPATVMPWPTDKNVLCQSLHPLKLIMNVSVTIENKGDFSENANVTVYLRHFGGPLHGQLTSQIGNQTFIPLALEQSRTLIISCCGWNDSGIEIGVYSIVARVEIPTDDVPDNNIGDSLLKIRVTITGDITGPDGIPDETVNMRDISMVAILFGVNTPDPKYDPNCDIIHDGTINMRDISLVAKLFGTGG